jgi:metallo-beta-lactamase family protein
MTKPMTNLERPESTILRFLGGAGTVTGSRFLLDTPRARVLVDCGLFQGVKELRLRNWEPMPVDPASLDCVIISHAHIDHCGYLPALWQAGFRGRVLATRGTLELCKVVLMDSARIQESDAAFANRHGYSKHEPALPLYTEEHASAVLGRFEVIPFHQRFACAEGIELEFHYAGHILGSAIVELQIDDEAQTRITFSGDLGRPEHPLLVPPDPPPESRIVVMESTYGDRCHEDDETIERFAHSIIQTVGRGGVAVIPAFAVDRTELVLRLLGELVEAGRIPEAPVYVDSPMALAALEIYRQAILEGWDEVRPELHGEEQPFTPGRLIEVRDVSESRELTAMSGPAIVISASGMATGGRVLHHLASRLPDSRNSVILVGYQAEGTRGRRLLQGCRTLKMLGRYIPVHAEVIDLTTFSVHADRDELIGWAGRAPAQPEMTFVVHGEPRSSGFLRNELEKKLNWTAVVPQYLERIRLS